jgi:hypothetical protein
MAVRAGFRTIILDRTPIGVPGRSLYSTVPLFARLRGLSMDRSFSRATWEANHWQATAATTGPPFAAEVHDYAFDGVTNWDPFPYRGYGRSSPL